MAPHFPLLLSPYFYLYMTPLQYVTVVEAGGTHATWSVFRVPTAHEGTPWLHPDAAWLGQATTQGLNPNQVSEPEVYERIGQGWLQVIKLIPAASHTAHIYWYGAGCASQDNKLLVLEALSFTSRLPKLHLHVSTDLALVAEALLLKQDGLILIMGTGAALAQVEKGRVVQIESSIFPKGNEGSGAYLGCKLYKYLKQQGAATIPPYLSEPYAWLQDYHPDQQPSMGAFFAHWLSFINSHPDADAEKLTQSLIQEGFSDALDAFFLKKAHAAHLLQNIVVCGSVAYHQQQYLKDAFYRAAVPTPLKVVQSVSKFWKEELFITIR